MIAVTRLAVLAAAFAALGAAKPPPAPAPDPAQVAKAAQACQAEGGFGLRFGGPAPESDEAQPLGAEWEPFTLVTRAHSPSGRLYQVMGTASFRDRATARAFLAGLDEQIRKDGRYATRQQEAYGLITWATPALTDDAGRDLYMFAFDTDVMVICNDRLGEAEALVAIMSH